MAAARLQSAVTPSDMLAVGPSLSVGLGDLAMVDQLLQVGGILANVRYREHTNKGPRAKTEGRRHPAARNASSA